MTEVEIKQDWLFGNALISFVGALLLGQVWERSEGTFKLLFIFEVPNYTGLTIFTIIAGFFILSFILAVASIVPRLRNTAIRLGTDFSMALDFIAWVAFSVSWLSSIPELPPDQWWSMFLLLGGFAFFIFIPIRMVLRGIRSKKAEAQSDGPD